MTVNVFAVPVFFVVFRESLEIVVVVSVLFAFLKQTLTGPGTDPLVYRKLCKQVWLGVGIGLGICLAIGAGMIGAFYGTGVDDYSNTEDYWEGAFAIFASLVIAILGAALLRVSKMKEKWAGKLAKAMQSHVEKHDQERGRFKRWAEKYVMFILPLITVLREGLEAIVFIAGVTFSSPASSVPLPVVIGLCAGAAAGYILYKGGASTKLQYFLILSTCLLYLVAAGLFSRGVWYLENAAWTKIVGGDLSEVGSGPGSYDISLSVWHINFGNPEENGGGGWGIFNAVLGWQNSATYGSVISYNIYWIAVMLGFIAMRYNEVRGHWPLMKPKKASEADSPASNIFIRDGSETGSGSIDKEKNLFVNAVPAASRTIEESA